MFVDQSNSFIMNSETSVHETYKLSGDANYGSWNFILEIILRREDMWRFSEFRKP